MSLYNERNTAKVCKLLEEGNTLKDAATLIGVNESTLHRWKNLHPSFASRVEAAAFSYKQKLIKIVTEKSATEPTGRTALEILARRYPKEWGEKLKLEGQIELTGPVIYKPTKRK